VASTIANDTPTHSAKFSCACERAESPTEDNAVSKRKSARSMKSETRLSGRTRSAYRLWQVSCRLYLATVINPRGDTIMDTVTFGWLLGSGAFLVWNWWRDRPYYRALDEYVGKHRDLRKQ